MKIVFGYIKKYHQYHNELYFGKSFVRLWRLFVNDCISEDEYHSTARQLWKVTPANYSNININKYKVIKIKRNL